MASESENEKKRETAADILADFRQYTVYANMPPEVVETIGCYLGRIEAAWKSERKLLRLCARWISTHDIYGHMAQEIIAECKKILGDDGKFLIPKEV